MQKKKKNGGFTLIEIILAMALLAIVVVMITPAIVSAFRMVVLSGDRLRASKGVAGDMELVLGGEPVTTTLGDVSIELPGGITVDGSKFVLSDSSKLGQVDLNGYLIESLPFQEPTGTSAEATPIPTPSPSPSPSPTPSPIVTPSPTPDPSLSPSPTPEVTPSPSPSPSPTPQPTPEPEIDLSDSTVDVSNWSTASPYGYIQLHNSLAGYLSKIEYRVVEDLSNSGPDYAPVTALNFQVYFADNEHNYTVLIRQTTNLGNTFQIYVRAAPRVYYYYPKSNKVSFKKLVDSTYSNIVSGDYIQQLSNATGYLWNTIPTNYEANDNQIDEANVVVRYAASLNADGVTIKDPPSFPMKVLGKAP